MATADYLSSADLKGVAVGGLIREDVMDQIWDISNVPLPFSDLLSGNDKSKNSYTEWTIDELAAPDLSNAKVDGQDSAENNSKTGARVGNHHQISTKEVQVTQRASASDTIGRQNELSYQVTERQKELRRDVEAISLSQQGSQADNGDATPGLAGAFASWLTSNTDTTGSDGGFATGTVSAATPGLKQTLTEDAVRNMASAIWEGGGNPTKIMSVPAVIRRMSEYMFTSSARIATLQSDTGQGESASVAKGSVNVFLTDFGVVLDMMANRLQPVYKDSGTVDDVADMLFIDPEYVRHTFLEGYMVTPLAKVGLTEKRMMSVDWSLKVLNEAAHGVIRCVDPVAPMTASAA